MPFVHIELVKGRSQAVKDAIAQDIIQSIAQHADVPVERIHVIFQEMDKENYIHLTNKN